VRQLSYESEPYLVRRMNLKKYISPAPDPVTTAMESSITGEVTGMTESELLSQMLHPAVGAALGETIHKRYISREDRPVDSITIDGLFNHSLLASALEFETVLHSSSVSSTSPSCQVPLSKWVGPEAADYCCAGKYRLSFSHWNRRSGSSRITTPTSETHCPSSPPRSPWAKALQSLVSSVQFISFLESLTGIQSLIPMKVPQEELQWAGSNVIGVTSGGYLLIHNDVSHPSSCFPPFLLPPGPVVQQFNTWNGLHRRVNVLLYLNEDWQPEW
jgi:hypothetical protein